MTSYLIPQTVYVGDRATLVVSLDSGPENYRPENELVFTGEPPVQPDLVIHRIELERRGEKGRLLIDFTAYAPGILELSSFEIGGVSFSGLRIEIASILGGDETAPVLSRPAPPLAVPGTGVLVYGTLSAMILGLMIFFWALIFGPRRFGRWLRKWKRRRLIGSLAGMERRLRRKINRESSAVKDFSPLLNVLTTEFRVFLALFTGENCRAMTAGEISRLPPLGEIPAAGGFSLTGAFLGGFFRRCDDLRFSGAEASKTELLDLLGELKSFTGALNRMEKFRPSGGTAFPAAKGAS
jgi:predicted RNA-binding protein